MKTLVRLSIGLCLIGALAFQVGARAQVRDPEERGNDPERDRPSPFAFAFIGDTPYGPVFEPQFDRVIGEINHDRAVEFVVHAGDIKAGSERCDNALILHRFEQYETIRRPFIFTPGDNEWTDCHRVNNGAYNPLERLAFLRSVFFPTPGRTTGGQRMRVRTQADGGDYPEFVENVLFRSHGVTFGTVHVVGSNNNLDPWSGIDASDSYATPRADRLAEFARRQAAALAWLDEIFAAAQESSGIFLTIQANPNFALAPTAQERLGFNAFLDRLALRAQAFGKPVMLAHGDNHVFFMDTPLPNLLFSRMQVFGSNQVHWVKVHVDAKASGVFSIEQKIVKANVN